MKQDNIQGLDCLIQAKNDSSKALILFHGYGASMNDLAPLANVLNFSGDFYFPQGIIEIPMSPYMKGYAWFQIDMELLEQKMSQGSFRDFADSTPMGFIEALDKMSGLINHLKTKYSEVIIGGFSQGAMCSLHLANKLSIQKIIMLSGNPVSMKDFDPKNIKLDFFQSHGKSDPVLSYSAATKMYKDLKEAGHKGRFISFEGGHEIPQNVLNELNLYLNGD